MWTIFKVFIEFVTVLFPFYMLAFRPKGMCDLSPWPGMETILPALAGGVLTTNHQPGKSPKCSLFNASKHL